MDTENPQRLVTSLRRLARIVGTNAPDFFKAWPKEAQRDPVVWFERTATGQEGFEITSAAMEEAGALRYLVAHEEAFKARDLDRAIAALEPLASGSPQSMKRKKPTARSLVLHSPASIISEERLEEHITGLRAVREARVLCETPLEQTLDSAFAVMQASARVNGLVEQPTVRCLTSHFGLIALAGLEARVSAAASRSVPKKVLTPASARYAALKMATLEPKGKGLDWKTLAETDKLSSQARTWAGLMAEQQENTVALHALLKALSVLVEDTRRDVLQAFMLKKKAIETTIPAYEKEQLRVENQLKNRLREMRLHLDAAFWIDVEKSLERITDVLPRAQGQLVHTYFQQIQRSVMK